MAAGLIALRLLARRFTIQVTRSLSLSLARSLSRSLALSLSSDRGAESCYLSYYLLCSRVLTYAHVCSRMLTHAVPERERDSGSRAAAYLLLPRSRHLQGTHFTCFTGTKVQILTHTHTHTHTHNYVAPGTLKFILGWGAFGSPTDYFLTRLHTVPSPTDIGDSLSLSSVSLSSPTDYLLTQLHTVHNDPQPKALSE